MSFSTRRHFDARSRSRRQFAIEPLESRQLLAVGPLLHTHNETQLAVVDASSGEIDVITRMTGFSQDDGRMADIAFSPTGRLVGVTRDWIYDIHPVTGELTPLGRHNVPQANSAVFDTNGRLQVMGRTNSELYEFTLDDTSITNRTLRATLGSFDAGEGSEGDISFVNGDLVVATTNSRLMFYRFDVGPTRPRLVREVDLAALGVPDIFGLALGDDGFLYGTTSDSVVQFDLSKNPVTIGEITVSDDQFGDLRGAAHYAEAGGPVPIGTMSGIKWVDDNGDGLKQVFEPILTDWPVYLDLDLDGTFDADEPIQRTDSSGRYHFFGYEPGFYTVAELIENPANWEQTYPQTPHPHLIGEYRFDNASAANQLVHDFGLPDMTASAVNLTGGSAVLVNASSFLSLPYAFGNEPFTIAIDATYNAQFASDVSILTQRETSDNVDRDFEMLATSPSKSITARYCNAAGTCADVTNGTIDGARHQLALTWDGEQVGSFFDSTLQTKTLSGTTLDIDGEVVRFGNPINTPTPAGLRGTIFEIRIFSGALSEAELQNAFQSIRVPNPYTVVLNNEAGIADLDFGNREPVVVELVPEIDVRQSSPDGTPIVTDGDPVDLGVMVVDEEPLRETFWVRNVGNDSLELSSLVASSGFSIDGSLPDSLAPGEEASFDVVLSDLAPGVKSGTVTIANNDANEDPFVINLVAIVNLVDDRPRVALINTVAGNIMRLDPITGIPESFLTGLPTMTDIAMDPTSNELYSIDGGFVYHIDVTTSTAEPLFTHGIRNASALAFSPTGQLFAAGEDVYTINLDAHTSTLYADAGNLIAGDIEFLGSRLFMTKTNGDFFEVRNSNVTRLGNFGAIALSGLAAIDPDTMYGFSGNRTYVVDVENVTATPQFNLFVFTIAGATYQITESLQNPRNALDVNDDGFVVPLDALLVINELNLREFSSPADGRITGSPTGMTKYPDVNGDGFITPIDALFVINYLNGVEAEPTTTISPASSDAIAEATETVTVVDDGLAVDDAMLSDLAMAATWQDADQLVKKRSHDE